MSFRSDGKVIRRTGARSDLSSALGALGLARSAYDITIDGSVLTIAAKKYLPSQQDETITDYTIETGTLQEASFRGLSSIGFKELSAERRVCGNDSPE